jgi:hypothetical protein
MAAILSLLTSKLAGLLASAAALLFAAGLAWQTERIDGMPLIGGGLKAQVAQLEAKVASDELARANTQVALLTAQAQRTAAANDAARAHEEARSANAKQIQTVIREVPIRVDAKSNNLCILPVGAVRLLDAAASGADPDTVAARVAPGIADDAPSGTALSEAITLLVDDLGRARDNADQLRLLQAAVRGNRNKDN